MKKLPENDLIRLAHMLDYARITQKFIAGKTRSDLDHDEMLTLALTRAIEVIGEAAANVTDGFKSTHPEIPWADITGMRNWLSHAYFNIDLNILWNTATDKIAPLVEHLIALLPEESDKE